jgi:regulator of sirC expression with transglutaminase-like and TPR domain
MTFDEALRRLAENPNAPLDVAELALLLARDEYPDLDVEAALGELSAMAREARAYVRGNLDARVAGLCRYLFHEMGFRGNTQDYYDPRNSYLNDVLDRRTGLPITLSVVAIAVGVRAGLNVAGVGLPGHFVAKAVEGGRHVLFDPFHGGRVLTETDCENLVRHTTGGEFRVTAEALRAVAPGALLGRMLLNLKGVYTRQGDFGRAVRVILRLRQLDPLDVTQERDLGICLMQAGRPGQAIGPLERYLTARGDGPDVEGVRELLRQARGEVARWN